MQIGIINALGWKNEWGGKWIGEKEENAIKTQK
jgi:hypothetical protein